jgi:hypothetical protein
MKRIYVSDEAADPIIVKRRVTLQTLHQHEYIRSHNLLSTRIDAKTLVYLNILFFKLISNMIKLLCVANSK